MVDVLESHITYPKAPNTLSASRAQQLQETGISVLDIEIEALQALRQAIGNNFVAACQLIFNCQGRVVVMGMGKSGHIGNKIAATLASTGTPAFFVHPAEASHGDLGMITAQDVIIALSHSGEAQEILTLLPFFKRQNIPLLCITGNTSSTLASAANVVLCVPVEQEACALGLAPTASTTAALALGDALAISVLKARGFTANDFARSHPGGKLGRRLLTRVSDIMHTGAQLPIVTESTLLSDAILEISSKRFGMALIVADNDKTNMVGIFTDGDLRRTLNQMPNIAQTPMHTVMTTCYKSITPHALAAEAVQLMETHQITHLPVLDDKQNLVGAFNLHDLLQSGVV